MPRRLRAPKLRRFTMTRRVADLSFDELGALLLPWAPTSRRVFASWADHAACYLAVRDELLAQLADHRWPPARTPFAEKVKRYRDRHGDEALASASYSDVIDDEEGEPQGAAGDEA